MEHHTTRRIGFTRFLSKCKKKGEVLILVEDVFEEVFGGFASQSLDIKEDFFGTGESFLFKVKVRMSITHRKKDFLCLIVP